MKIRKISASLMIALISMLVLAGNISKTKAATTITIRANGSVSPQSAPISTLDNITYTLIENINSSIFIERSNIIFDGAGHTVQGDGGGNGISLYLVSNVMIRNIMIRGFNYGIFFTLTTKSMITQSQITTNSYDGIQFFKSTWNTVSASRIEESGNDGIKLLNSSNYNTISDNLLNGNNDDGVQISDSSNNIVKLNNVTANTDSGINLRGCFNMSATENIVSENLNGFELYSCNNTQVKQNEILYNSYYGIFLDQSHNNHLISNNITANYYGIYDYISSNNELRQNIIKSNTADAIWLDYASEETVAENDIESNTGVGLYIRYSSNNTVTTNELNSNLQGMYFSGSSDNVVDANNLTSNSYGVVLTYNSLRDKFFHNNFVNNAQQASSSTSVSWNNIIEGNYWSSYSGTDGNDDGIGDANYTIDASNIDHFPLKGMFHTFNTSQGFQVEVISNSSTRGFEEIGLAPSNAVKLNVLNMTLSQTYGFCRISIPKAFMKPPFNVTANGTTPNLVNSSLYEDATGRWIYLSYAHSTVEILIQGVESTSPLINIISPENRTYPTTDVPLTFTVNEPTSWIGYSLDGLANVTTTMNTTLTSLSNGGHTVIAFANDTVGNTGKSDTVEFSVDTNPPEIAIISPENITYGSDRVVYNFRINEPISWIGYSLNGESNVTINGNGTIGPLLDGAYQLIAYANDTLGNMGVSNPVHFTVFSPAPGLTILSPENRTYSITTIPLNFTSDEATSWIGYSLDGQTNMTIAQNTTLTSLTEGRHRIVLYANDTEANMGISNTVHFMIDVTSPEIAGVTQTPPIENVQQVDTVRVDVTVTDELSGVKLVILNYTTDNLSWASIEMTHIGPNSWNGTIPEHLMGTNVTYVIIARDMANNTVTSTELGYTYTYTVIPELSLVSSILVLTSMMTLLIFATRRRKITASLR